MFFLLNLSNTVGRNTELTELSDKEYVTFLYETYYGALWKYALFLTNNNDTVASDIISITFLKVLEQIYSIRKIKRYKIKAYLKKTVYNNYLNYIKKESSLDNLVETSKYTCLSIENDFSENIGTSDVEDALNHMPEPYKSILYYKYGYEELSYDEIADLLEINRKSIRMYAKRAIDMLRQRMNGGETNE